MNFIRKHYEKIILASFLLVFILALVYLITVFSQSSEVSKKDLVLKELKADYNSVFNLDGGEKAEGEEDKKYNQAFNLKNASSWTKTKIKNQSSPVHSDLMIPIKAARCPNCKKIIPSIYFEKNEPCVLCGGPLKELIVLDETFDDVDSDGDDMPDSFEKKYGLNHKLADDKMEDLDNDAFPNYIEFLAKTKPNDPKSHPPLTQRIALVGVKRTKLPILLWNVLSHGSEDKSKWLIQIKVKNKRNKWVSKFPKFDTTIKVGHEIYRITDVNYIVKEKFDKKLGAPKSTNMSTITIKNTIKEDETPIVAVFKKKVYENLVKIRLVDEFTRKSYILKVGDLFTIGDSLVGLDKMKLLTLNGTKSVTIKKDIKEGKDSIIGKKSKLKMQINDINKKDNVDLDVKKRVMPERFKQPNDFRRPKNF